MQYSYFYQKSIESLTEIGKLESEFFKKRAYRNAVNSIKNWVSNHSYREFYELADYSDLKGIGSGINGKIIELKTQGIIHHLIDLRKSVAPTELNPELYKVRKGYITKRIPYEDAMRYYNLIKSYGIKVQSAGSLRRQKKLIGDIDILVSSESYAKLISKILDYPGFEIIVQGDKKTSIMIDKINNIQVDIISVTREDYPFQLLYLTGSQMFNINMRHIAKEHGYRLNQYGLWYQTPEGERSVNCATEKDIFTALNISYIEPKDR